MVEPLGVQPQRQAPPRTLTLAPRRKSRWPVWRGAGLVALAVGVILANWLLVRGDRSYPVPVSGPVAVHVSESGLKTLAAAVPNPIYWAGPLRGYTYELSKNSDDLVWIRYLPAGTAVGSNTLTLTIGTYPMADAYTVTSGLAEQTGSVKVPIEGGVAFFEANAPTSIYLAFPGVDAQVEVYDPSSARAREVVATGLVQAASA